MTYCSRACQRAEWLNGHNQVCCKEYTDEYMGVFQGRIMPFSAPEDERAAKLEELEINNNMIQLKLFLDHSVTILEQVKSLNIPVYDCIVKFDLTHCPPKVTTYHYSNVYGTKPGKEHYEASRSEKNITCMYSSYNLVRGMTDHLGKPATILGMQRLFPCEWLTQKK